MMSEQNKALAKEFFGLFRPGSRDNFDEIVHSNFQHNSWPWATPGAAGIRELIAMVDTGFTDFGFQIEDAIAEGDKVVFRVSESATHNGEMMGIPGTGKKISWTGIHIFRIEDGKIAEHWREQDMLGFMQQMGAVES